MALDHQWPSAARLPARFAPRHAPLSRLEALSRRIEEVFESRLGAHAVLVPSARAGLAMILRAHSFGRAHFVHVPQWVSHCVWDVVGRYSNPVASFSPRPDAVLAVHKWGTSSRLSSPGRALVIEDSVDSLFTSPKPLFANDGDYELLSLPKIFGAYCGGAVLTRDRAAAQRLRALRREPRLPLTPAPYRIAGAVGGRAGAADLAVQQSALKHAAARAEFAGRSAFMEWEYLEFENVLLDLSALEHIESAVAHWDECAEVIERRAESASRADAGLARRLELSTGRLPPLLTVPCADEAAARQAGLLVRRYDSRRSVDRPSYRPVALLPLHFGVPEAEFRRLLRAALRLRG